VRRADGKAEGFETVTTVFDDVSALFVWQISHAILSFPALAVEGVRRFPQAVQKRSELIEVIASAHVSWLDM
jgi:hypothetical protein